MANRFIHFISAIFTGLCWLSVVRQNGYFICHLIHSNQPSIFNSNFQIEIENMHLFTSQITNDNNES